MYFQARTINTVVSMWFLFMASNSTEENEDHIQRTSGEKSDGLEYAIDGAGSVLLCR